MAKFHQFTANDVDMLARTIWGEARGEGVEGMSAAANVVVNRYLYAQEHPGIRGLFGRSLQGTMMAGEGRQFNCWMPGDDNYTQVLNVTSNNPLFVKARAVAYGVLTGEIPDNTGGADHYFNPHSAQPTWAKDGQQLGLIGHHRFSNIYGHPSGRNFSDHIDMGSDPITPLYKEFQDAPQSFDTIDSGIRAQELMLQVAQFRTDNASTLGMPVTNATPDIGLNLALSDITPSAIPHDAATIASGLDAQTYIIETSGLPATAPANTLADAGLALALPQAAPEVEVATPVAATIIHPPEIAALAAVSMPPLPIPRPDHAATAEAAATPPQTISEQFRENQEIMFQTGDSVTKIALSLGVAKDDLDEYAEKFEELNHISNASRVRAGTTYIMPAVDAAPATAETASVPAIASEALQESRKGPLAKIFDLQVQKGQSLTEIAQALKPENTDREDLLLAKEIAAQNGIKNPDLIQSGQSLHFRLP